MNEYDVQQLVHNEYAKTSIRVKARQLCRRADFNRSEREDVEQDLWLHLLTQAQNFDSERSALNTFIDRMVNSAAAHLVRRRESDMRADGFRTHSLDASPRGKDQHKKSLRSSLSPDDGTRRSFTIPKSDLDEFENREALEFALASMPDGVRNLCSRVMGGESPTALARELGISRRRVRRMLDEAREHLERAGFGEE
jgi:RNA polymerase sigma factor (sigma-70 family)